ncbi:hypothetical protein [Tautonia sociabilis]|nr:hypothetical protein [Tautonia sociabilis]
MAVACFDLGARTLAAFGVFPSLARFAAALDAECRFLGHRVATSVAAD